MRKVWQMFQDQRLGEGTHGSAQLDEWSNNETKRPDLVQLFQDPTLRLAAGSFALSMDG